MKRIIRKGLITLYALYFHLVYYQAKPKEDNGNILIVYYGIIGDAVLFADYLAMFHKIFPKEKGYQIEVLCFKSCRKIWQDFFEHEYQVKFLDVYIDDTENTWMNYGKVIRFFQGKYYQKIFALPIANPRGDKLVYNIAGKEKIICGENETPGKWGLSYLYHRYFYEHAYHARIQNPMGTMEIRRYADLIHRYADFPVPVKISHMKTMEKIIVSERYCVIGLGASTSEKTWETSKYLEIIHYLWNKYHLVSYLCGEDNERDLYEQIEKAGKCDYIKSYIGKTNFREWISLIQGASLYVGNDSAGVHIAASVSVPSIVIVGKWQYKRFFPYDKELEKGNEILPYPVFSEQNYDCTNCREKHMKKGIGNRECKKAVKAGKPCLCVSDVTVEQVRDAIDQTIDKYSIQ